MDQPPPSTPRSRVGVAAFLHRDAPLGLSACTSSLPPSP
nr:MAG TPA: hypothetical protein [Caudoviricetes sp.]